MNTNQKTYLPSIKEIEKNRKWHFIDASGQVLGRLATRIAVLLSGKHKKEYTPHIDCGDFVVVTNSDKIKLTGNKEEEKFYFRHSGYAKGAKIIPFKEQMAKDSTKVIYLAVKRMLDDNKLRDKRLRRLKIYKDDKTDFVKRG